MEYYWWIGFILIIFIIFRKKRQRAVAAWQIHRHRKQEGEMLNMKELAKQFVGKECIIYTITSNDGNIVGIIKEVAEGGMIIERSSGEHEIINLDFVTRIREYPRKKNGKKKDIVLD